MRSLNVALTLVASLTQTPSTTKPGLVVSLDWLAAHLKDPNVVVITAADEQSHLAGHIPGARALGHMATLDGDHHLLRPEALAAALAQAGARDDAHIVLYGSSAMETGWLYMAFASIGHAEHVSILDGSLEAWRRAGKPVETTATPIARGYLTPRPSSDVIVDAKYVKERLQSPAVKILDVRSDQERARGYIPGSTLVLWQELFTDQKLLTFKARDEIRALLTRAGVTDDKQAVTYCAVGMRASLMYFAARYAGVPARVYVGSWQDWASNNTNPIAR
jgi:thiosulfate/3-mercaptopyruvate sulfurtransferase